MTDRARPRRTLQVLGFVIASAVASATLAVFGAAATPDRVDITALSNDPALVSGGDVLLRVRLPQGLRDEDVRVTVAGRDVTSAFHGGPDHALIGLVSGLTVGKNTVTVATKARATDASLDITNYPITGPIFSGPQIKPFICQTNTFRLPDGTTLGAPLDENCSAKTVIQYVYRSNAPAAAPSASPAGGAAGRAGRAGGRGDAPPPFKPLTNLTTLPPDVAKTTTLTGETVNFIVRVETGTMNRGIYQNAILHDPTVDPAPTPQTPPRGWNRRLIGVHGSGCPGGWYIQGGAMGVSPLDVTRLGEGFALFVNSLNHPTNSCNAIVAAEAAMMGKEHFIEEFGVPSYTMSTGGSGGAYTSLQISDAFPGIFDGVTISATFPDALSIALAGLDAHLMTHYFRAPAAANLTDAQKLAITGYQSIKAFEDAANQSQRTDPVPNRADIDGYQSARWNAVVPEDIRYDPVKNPKGARPTVFDVARNVYGINPKTGAALRPYDNVGVQYGLNALNSGAITVQQFLELNEKIGGYDQDANYTAARAVGDAGAIKRTYQSGLLLSGAGGLSTIPIFDNATSNEAGGYHYGWFHFALRERVRQAQGGQSPNMVMWRSVSAPAAKKTFDEWMAAYAADTSGDSKKAKVLRTKPAMAVEGCYDDTNPPKFVREDLVFTSKPTTKCSALYPVYSNTRREAGGPLAGNVLKCQLKPIDAHDYQATLTPAELARLKSVFPSGVCDYAKPGVNQTPLVTWASYGPSPKNLVFDVTKP
jgi:hypothetical protein